MNKGIDYGFGKTNIDTKNNIRFGVIHQNEVLQAWADDSEPVYFYCCPYCGNELDNPNEYPDFSDDENPVICKSCKKELQENDFWEIEPVCYKYEAEGYFITSDSYGDLFIEKSPYYTYAQFCSPCAPGACHLSNPLDEKDENNKCYCIGPNWFDNEKAPYKVYSVKTNEIIN